MKNWRIKEGTDYEVKEIFKDYSKIIKEHFKDTTQLSLLDIGCATGALVHFLKNDLKTSGNVCGLDIEKDYIVNARKRFSSSNINFHVGNAIDFDLNCKFDVVTASSIITCFDEPDIFLRNVIKHLNNRGVAIISSIFNEYDIEVRIKHKLPGHNEWRSTFNQFSLKKVKMLINDMGYICKITEQAMPFDIPRDHQNPARAWSVMLDDVRYNMNGLHLIWNIKILKITSKNNLL
tara:strand:- start:2933 stop:3634 length:702 start_codon:yes stop_codon:yes gene_type:complete